MANIFGTLIQRGKYFAWKYKSPVTGKSTHQSLRDEDGFKITDRDQALKRMHQLASEKFRIEALNSKIEYIQQVAEVKQIIHTCKVKFKDLRQTFDEHPARRDGQLENKFSSINHIVSLVQQWHPEIRLLSEMSEEIAGEYLTQYWKSGISPKTYNTRLQCLKMIFRLFLKEESPLQRLPI